MYRRVQKVGMDGELEVLCPLSVSRREQEKYDTRLSSSDDDDCDILPDILPCSVRSHACRKCALTSCKLNRISLYIVQTLRAVSECRRLANLRKGASLLYFSFWFLLQLKLSPRWSRSSSERRMWSTRSRTFASACRAPLRSALGRDDIWLNRE